VVFHKIPPDGDYYIIGGKRDVKQCVCTGWAVSHKKWTPAVLFHPEPEGKAFSFHYKNRQASEAMPAGDRVKITEYPDHHRKV
jgi:hypothetical protein